MKSGLILFNKKPGITSFDALRDIKRSLGTGKVGHTGTLDKFAQGLLIVLVGRALRLSQWFTNCDKKYIGKIHFGIETDTLDPEGKTIHEAAVPTRQRVEEVLIQFTGDILQAPPVYSAIHIDGKRASSMARSGDIPEMKKRPVTVYKLELLSWEPPFADIFVHCSSGTYIRSLARDIALAAGSRAHLCELKRTQVGGFELSHTETRRHGEHGEEGSLFLKPIDKSVISKLGISWFEIEENEIEYIIHGKPLDFLLKSKILNPSVSSVPPCVEPLGSKCVKSSLDPSESIAVFCDEKLIAIIEKIDKKWKYACVFNQNS